MKRRTFVKLGTAGTAALGLTPALALSNAPTDDTADLNHLRSLVKFFGDGPSLSPPEYADILQSIINEKGIEPDYYTLGGVVDDLEAKMADLLGKERAIFMPTGTLANHLAIRIQAGGKPRVIVQNDSHIYNDCGDGAQILSNLNLVPMAHDKATFTLDEVKAVIERTDSGRVTADIGVIMIESPMRRRKGEMFDYEEMKRICAYARSEGIATHLDGARVFMASGYTGISPKEYASHFDTVYASMWKYFNAPSGAILAGPAHLLDGLYHTRRMFGGGLPYAWPFAAMALHFVEGFETRFKAGIERATALFEGLNQHEAFRVENVPNGSNVVKLHVQTSDLKAFRSNLKGAGILIRRPESWGFYLQVNETLTRKPVAEIVNIFAQALSA